MRHIEIPCTWTGDDVKCGITRVCPAGDTCFNIYIYWTQAKFNRQNMKCCSLKVCLAEESIIPLSYNLILGYQFMQLSETSSCAIICTFIEAFFSKCVVDWEKGSFGIAHSF